MPDYVIEQMDRESARAILSWDYPPPYDVYNPPRTKSVLESLITPRHQYYAIKDARGELAGHCCFGAHARVPGGDYSAEALDIGLGMRPDLTGQGRGGAFFAAILDFARGRFNFDQFRVTVAAFNRRAQRVYARAGFSEVQSFRKETTGMRFLVMSRAADAEGQSSV